VLIDLIVGIGLPFILMVLCLSWSSNLSLAHPGHPYPAFLVQTSRFIIVEDFECDMPILPSWVTLVIISIPPILLELIAGVHDGCLSIHALYNRSKLN
jgi:hypothetical protein